MEIIKYSFREGSTYPQSKAESVGRELLRIKNKYNKLLARDVVREARKKSNPIHEFITWDNSKAARMWREEEAQQLIIAVKVEFTGPTDKPSADYRLFVSVSNPSGNGEPKKQYVDIGAALDDDDMRNQVLKQALSELVSFKRKYGLLSELAGLFETIDQLEMTLQPGKEVRV